MVEHRKLLKSHPHDYRLYKAGTMQEILELKKNFEVNYKKSVFVEDFGVVDEEKLRQFEKMCDDLAYMQLKLKPTDVFLLSKELTTLKLEEAKRIEKVVHKSKSNLSKSPKFWSEEQLKRLWLGTSEAVSRIVNKKADAVERKRKEYILLHPDFIIPDYCKTPRKNAKALPVKKEWTKQEDKILWLYTGAELSKLLNRNKFDIAGRRREYCINNPNFVIPVSCEFRKGSLPNEVSVKENKKEKPADLPQAVPINSNTIEIQQQQSQQNDQSVDENEISKLASLINKLKIKPNKVKYGNVTLEF